MPLIHVNRRNLKYRHGLNGHSLWAILVGLIYVCGLASCGDTDNVSPPPAGPGPLTIVTNSPLPRRHGQSTLCHRLRRFGGHHTLHLESRQRLSRPTGRPLLGRHSRHYYWHTDSPWNDHSDIQSRRFVVAGTGCAEIADNHNHFDPTAAGDFHLIAPGGNCEPTLQSHHLASDGWNPTIYMVGESSVAERIAVECSLARDDHRYSAEWNGGHDDTYVYSY